MRKLLAWNMITLDGYFEGAQPWDLSFHSTVWGPELEAMSRQQLEGDTTLIFGRRTYEGMAAYWPTASDEGEVAVRMNAVPKIVVSNTLTSADWNNTRVLNGGAAQTIAALKGEEGGDLYVFGSAQLLDSLLAAGLVDEYRLCLTPVVQGRGTPLFKPAEEPKNWTLLEARALQTGGVVLRYRVKG
ncbi:dihydrofolate reductase family protein [Devosia sp. 1566]|uniref:dihydrofolate reductase family protein n=1 Tax=Devosia sp. 1566 TaxID=2499144 RepID=UPI000FD73944|nr:dihydrofolate reductase family protein [Devosia sp. 1566]